MSEFLSAGSESTDHNGSTSNIVPPSAPLLPQPLLPPQAPLLPQPQPPLLPPQPPAMLVTVTAPTAQPLPGLSNEVSDGRGRSKGVPEWNNGTKITVEFNDKFQPVGPRAAHLKSQLGVMNNVVNVPEGYKVVCLRSCNLLWKGHKGKIKAKYYKDHQDDPELASKYPPNIVPEQWRVLVAYWRSADAQEISLQNSKNRDQHGPIHITGRTSFAEIRHKMEKGGEDVDKMSVWIKSRNKEDPDVLAAIEEFNLLLSKEPEEQRELTMVKDKIFHLIIGADGHGYCRTFGSSVPPSMVYPSDPSASSSAPPTLVQKTIEELTEKIIRDVTEQVIKALTAKMAEDMDKLRAQYALNYQQLHARVSCLESFDGISANSHAQVRHEPISSVHHKESIGDDIELLLSDDEEAGKENDEGDSPKKGA